MGSNISRPHLHAPCPNMQAVVYAYNLMDSAYNPAIESLPNTGDAMVKTQQDELKTSGVQEMTSIMRDRVWTLSIL